MQDDCCLGRLLGQISQKWNRNVYSVTTSSEGDVQQTLSKIQHVLYCMEDDGKVVWAPEYAAAAVQRSTTAPRPRSEVLVLGLAGWKTHLHRYERVHNQ